MISNTSAAGAPTNILNAEQSAQTFFGPASNSQTSQEFTVDQFPVSFAAFNLGSDDVITVQQIVSHGGTKLVSTYQPVFGPAVLNANTSKLIIEHPGRYQLHHTGSSSLGTFTVLGGAYSSTSSGFAQLAAALQAVTTGLSVNGVVPVHVTGAGTTTSPYVISTPWITVEETIFPANGSVKIGYNAVATTLTNSISIGTGAGAPTTTVTTADNIIIGSAAGVFSVSGSYLQNVFIGSSAGRGSTAFSNAVAIGYHAGSTFLADGSTAVGAFSGSIPNFTKGTAIGYQAGQGTNGTNLTAVGYQAGFTISHSGTFLGALAGSGETHLNPIIINNPSGTALNATQDNQVVIGDSSITQLVTAGSIIQGGVISASDERLKNHIEAEWDVLDKISRLSPVTFRWNKDAIKELNAIVDEKEQDEIQHGLIAQEVEDIYPELIEEVDRGKGPYKLIRYDRLVSILLAAVQELSEKVTALEDKANG
jgi:hypothetical protein